MGPRKQKSAKGRPPDSTREANLASFAWLHEIFSDSLDAEEALLGVEEALFSERVDAGAFAEIIRLAAVTAEAKLAPEHNVLLMVCKNLLLMQWDKLSDTVDSWMESQPTGVQRPVDEFDYFCMVAKYRQGDASGASEVATRILASVNLDRNADLYQRTVIEQSSWLMNQGRYRECIAVQDKLMVETHPLFPYAAYRHHTISCVCHQALGRYGEAHFHLRESENIAEKKKALSGFAFSVQRRKLSLFAESESLEEMHQLLTELNHKDRFPGAFDRLLFMIETLRYQILMDHTEMIKASYQEILRLISENRFPENLILLSEEWCEVILKTEPNDSALDAISTRLDKTPAHQLSARTMYLFYRGRAQALVGEHAAAIESLEAALDIAESEEYGKSRVRALFFLSGLHQRYGDRVQSKVLLAKGMELAGAFGLRIQHACGLFIQHYLSTRPAQRIAGLRFFQDLPTIAELIYYLDFYQIDDASQHTLRASDGSKKAVTLFGLLVMMKRYPGLYFDRKSGYLIFSEHERFRLVAFDDKQLLMEAFRMVAKSQARGFRLQDLHRLQMPKVAFDPYRHGHRVRMLLSRLRQFLEPLGCRIGYSASDKRYYMHSRQPILEISPARAAPRAKPVDRTKQILALVSKHQRVTSGELCKALKLTRQSLNPYLRELVDSGVLDLKRRGRSSYYTLRQLDSSGSSIGQRNSN